MDGAVDEVPDRSSTALLLLHSYETVSLMQGSAFIPFPQFIPIMLIQLLNLFWYFLILRIMIR
jgi:hypothetical protein